MEPMPYITGGTGSLAGGAYLVSNHQNCRAWDAVGSIEWSKLGIPAFLSRDEHQELNLGDALRMRIQMRLLSKRECDRISDAMQRLSPGRQCRGVARGR